MFVSFVNFFDSLLDRAALVPIAFVMNQMNELVGQFARIFMFPVARTNDSIGFGLTLRLTQFRRIFSLATLTRACDRF